MGCLKLSVEPIPRPKLNVSANVHASLTVSSQQRPSLAVRADSPAKLSVSAASQVQLRAVPQKQISLIVGEVCTVSSGTITVLASTDGPLRFSNGDYWLLDPSEETDN